MPNCFKCHSVEVPKMFAVCPACQAAIDQAKAEQLTPRWQAICPRDYRTIDRKRLPAADKLDGVLDWEYGAMGLMLYGPTGRGKTRAAWALMEKLFFAGRSVRALDSMAGLRYAALYARGAELVEVWIDELISVDVLLLDDVFKNKLTDSFEGVIFTLIDQRIAAQLPTILTSNDTGETLKGRVTVDRSAPLLRRLREHCIQIHF